MFTFPRVLKAMVLMAPIAATLAVPSIGAAAPTGPIAFPPQPPIATVTVAPSQILTDAGFEGTLPSGWIKSEGAWPSTVHHCGAKSMSLGILGNAFVFQNVTIPANAQIATLGFYLRVDSSVTSTSPVDTLLVEIKTAPNLPATGTTLASLATYSNLDTTGNQFVRKGEFDLSMFKGQTIGVWFSALFGQHASQFTQFYIDDVALWTRAHLNLNLC